MRGVHGGVIQVGDHGAHLLADGRAARLARGQHGVACLAQVFAQGAICEVLPLPSEPSKVMNID